MFRECFFKRPGDGLEEKLGPAYGRYMQVPLELGLLSMPAAALEPDTPLKLPDYKKQGSAQVMTTARPLHCHVRICSFDAGSSHR